MTNVRIYGFYFYFYYAFVVKYPMAVVRSVYDFVFAFVYASSHIGARPILDNFPSFFLMTTCANDTYSLCA